MTEIKKIEKKYEIGKICVTESGKWWVEWMGKHYEQGGANFTVGNLGSENLDTLFKNVAENMTQCKDIYIERITNIEGEKDDTDHADI